MGLNLPIGKIIQLTRINAVTIDQSAVKGEKGTGYEDGSNGPFACGNCRHYAAGSCNQPIMRRESKLLRNKDGNVKVAVDGCCEYVDRK